MPEPTAFLRDLADRLEWSAAQLQHVAAHLGDQGCQADMSLIVQFVRMRAARLRADIIKIEAMTPPPPFPMPEAPTEA